jgi:hypothetical protein
MKSRFKTLPIVLGSLGPLATKLSYGWPGSSANAMRIG